MAVGYTTREFYENKTKLSIQIDEYEFTQLSENVEEYINSLVKQKDKIAESFAKFMNDIENLMKDLTVAI